MRMEYFKKLQCYKPKKAIIDSPISIEEVALLQNSVDKDILGRIKFINRSQQSIIAIFVHLSASNIAGENVPVEKERYIYQDMKIDPGELYGNKIPLHLPDDARLLTVKLEKVVFENGEIWDAATGTECDYIPQEEIDIPEEIIDKVQEELTTHFSHMEYVHYFYEEGQNFWECTCGKVNSVLNKKCSFCQNDRQAQKEYLVQDKLIPLVAQKKQEKQAEDEEKARQEAEKARLQREEEQREYEERQKRWAKEQEQKEIEEQKQALKKLCIFGAITAVVLVTVCVYSHQHRKKQMEAYQQGTIAYEKGDYEKAVDQFEKASEYEDADEKLEDSLKEVVKIDKEKWLKYLDSDSFETEGELDSFVNVLCYLGKPKDFVLHNADFAVNAEKEDDEYTYKCDYQLEHDWEFLLYYVELNFDEEDQNILNSITFHGANDVMSADGVSRFLNQEYDNASYSSYSWDISDSNELCSKVYFGDFFNDYDLEFYK